MIYLTEFILSIFSFYKLLLVYFIAKCSFHVYSKELQIVEINILNFKESVVTIVFSYCTFTSAYSHLFLSNG